MPLVLAIESSTPRASLALVRDSRVIFDESFESDRHHNAVLFAPLQRAIDAMAGECLDLVLIGTGPGSYSGTRVGIAAGQGVAMVHRCPAVGLSSLLATDLRDGLALGDARRGSAWWTDVRQGSLPDPALVPSDQLASKLHEGSVPFTFEELGKLGLPNDITVSSKTPSAAWLVEAWHALPESTQEELKALPPQPAYLRPPHITEAKKGHPLLRSGDKRQAP